MTLQASSALTLTAHTVPPEARHGHDSACYWDVENCRWRCVTYPGVRYTPERCTTIGRLVAHTGSETRP